MIDELHVDWASLTKADMYTIIKQTEEQNAKLRELVKRMYPFVEAYMETLPNMWIDGMEGFDIARVVQELGIDVDS